MAMSATTPSAAAPSEVGYTNRTVESSTQKKKVTSQVARQIQLMATQKALAVEQENYDEAKRLKTAIESLNSV